MGIFKKKDRVIELSERERVQPCEIDNSLCYLHLNWYH